MFRLWMESPGGFHKLLTGEGRQRAQSDSEMLRLHQVFVWPKLKQNEANQSNKITKKATSPLQYSASVLPPQ